MYILYISVTYSFTKVTATLLNNTQYRLASAHWTGLSSSLTCASEALHSYPDSRAYVFEPGSGLCTPFLWLHEGTGLASTELPPGNLYVSQGQLCPYPFQVRHGGYCRLNVDQLILYDVTLLSFWHKSFLLVLRKSTKTGLFPVYFLLKLLYL